MDIISLTSLSAILGLLVIFVSTIKSEKRKKLYGKILGIAICAVTIFDNCNHTKKDTNKDNKISNLDSNVIKLNDSISDLKGVFSIHLASIDSSLKPYNLKLQDFKAMPINITFTDNSQNVTSNNQSGGQTAHTIHNPK